MARRVTAKWLRAKDACDKEVEVFEKEWPDGVEVNAESLRRACKLGLNLWWFGSNWFPPQKRWDFDKETAAARSAWVDFPGGTDLAEARSNRKFSRACLEPFIRQVEAGRG